MLKDVSIETDRRTSLNFWNQTLEQTGGSEPADEHTEQRAKKEGRRALREEAPHRGRELGFGERGPSPRSTCSSVTELSEEGLRPGTAQMSQRREGPWRGQHSSRRGPCWGPHSRLSSLSVSGNLSLPGARARKESAQTRGLWPPSHWSPCELHAQARRTPGHRCLLHSPSRSAHLHGHLS